MQFLLEDEDYNNIVDRNYCLYFYTKWMPYNKKMLSLIEKTEKEQNVKFVGVDADKFKNLCKKYTINYVPQIVILNNNTDVFHIKGVPLSATLKSSVIKYIGDKNDKRKSSSEDG